MKSLKRASVPRELTALFNHGPLGGLTDGQLLERYATGGGEVAELAFAALVERHGPIVYRICRAILSDDEDAQDAFQATFLVLVHRNGSLWVRDSIGPWLFAVADRVAACLRASQKRRLRHEANYAATAQPQEAATQLPDDDSLWAGLHAELKTLPTRYRDAVLLCDLEGRTHEQAARHMGCPIGTVKSRLARGREHLRAKLIRRGLAPAAAVAALGHSARAFLTDVPTAIVESTSKAALRLACGSIRSAGALGSPAEELANRVLALLTADACRRNLAIVLVVGMASLGIGTLAQSKAGDAGLAPAQAATPKSERPQTKESVRSRASTALEEALRAAEQISNPWLKVRAIADIAAAQTRIGQAEASKATFRRAEELLDQLETNPRAPLGGLTVLAQAKALAGDRPGTRVLVRTMIEQASKLRRPKNDLGLELLKTAAVYIARAGDPQGALELVDGVENPLPEDLAFALSEIAGTQATSGDVPAARATMKRADEAARRAGEAAVPRVAGKPDPLDFMRLAQVRGLAPLAVAEAKIGAMDAARATVKQALLIAEQTQLSRESPLAQIAMAQRALGDRVAADQTLARAIDFALGRESPAAKVESLGRVAIIQADHGAPVEGKETLQRALIIARASHFAHPASGIMDQVLSGARARVGDFDEARADALGLRDAYLRATHLERVAAGQSKAGQSAAAIQWAGSHADPLLRAHAFLGVARGLIDLDEKHLPRAK